jgi:hypothetical protein
VGFGVDLDLLATLHRRNSLFSYCPLFDCQLSLFVEPSDQPSLELSDVGLLAGTYPMAWNTEPRSAVLKTACVTLAGPIISAEVVRFCGSNSRGALPELSGIGVVGISDELTGGEVLLGWNVFGAEVLFGAGVGEPIEGTVIAGDPIDGAATDGADMLGAAIPGDPIAGPDIAGWLV